MYASARTLNRRRIRITGRTGDTAQSNAVMFAAVSENAFGSSHSFCSQMRRETKNQKTLSRVVSTYVAMHHHASNILKSSSRSNCTLRRFVNASQIVTRTSRIIQERSQVIETRIFEIFHLLNAVFWTIEPGHTMSKHTPELDFTLSTLEAVSCCSQESHLQPTFIRRSSAIARI